MILIFLFVFVSARYGHGYVGSTTPGELTWENGKKPNKASAENKATRKLRTRAAASVYSVSTREAFVRREMPLVKGNRPSGYVAK